MDTDLLRGWRSIASYFNRSPLTVQRWTRKHGVPVARLGRSVYASRIGIAFWIERLAANQRASRAARAAAARGAKAETMNEFVRAETGAALRQRLAEMAKAGGSASQRASVKQSITHHRCSRCDLGGRYCTGSAIRPRG